ncbi:hypothetical protein ABBQ32_007718 [Trebouxia sp. C0010 RCD-2024]
MSCLQISPVRSRVLHSLSRMCRQPESLLVKYTDMKTARLTAAMYLVQDLLTTFLHSGHICLFGAPLRPWRSWLWRRGCPASRLWNFVVDLKIAERTKFSMRSPHHTLGSQRSRTQQPNDDSHRCLKPTVGSRL